MHNPVAKDKSTILRSCIDDDYDDDGLQDDCGKTQANGATLHCCDKDDGNAASATSAPKAVTVIAVMLSLALRSF